MKTFKVNRNSWHYRFQDTMETDPRLRKDFCSYWRGLVYAFLKVVWLMLGLVVITITTLFVLNGIGVLVFLLVYPDITWTSLNAVSATLLGGGIISIALYIWYKIATREKKNAENKQLSIVATKYRSWKDKVCYKVEFHD